MLGCICTITAPALCLYRYCEESLVESVATLIWVAPRLSSDIQELNQVI